MSQAWTLWVSTLTAGIAAAVVISLIVSRRWQFALDQPNERSLHQTPTPRTGGIGIAAGVLAAALAIQLQTGQWLWLETTLAALLAAVSLIDDKRGLPVAVRLAAHLGITSAYSAIALYAPTSAASVGSAAFAIIVLYAVLIAAAANFYNFMDGANGLAGGMGCIGFCAYAWCAWPANPGVAGLSLAVAGAAAGFLLFNLTGRIFMGDSGSVPLGFLAAALGLNGIVSGLWPGWFPLLVFAPFLVDASVTLARRILRGEKFWQAHRQHYYQRVILMGASHLQLACGEYGLMLLCAAAAIYAQTLGASGQAAVFATIGALFLILMLVIDACWKRFGPRP